MARKEASIYKRKDGRWEARYVKEIGVDGKKRYGSVYGKTYIAFKRKAGTARTRTQIIHINGTSAQ